MNMDLKWLAQSTIYRDSVDLVAVADFGHERNVAQPVRLTMKRLEEHGYIPEPTISLAPNSARSLLQALWDAGIRPAEWSSPDGEINALRNHVSFAEHVAKTLLLPKTTLT